MAAVGRCSLATPSCRSRMGKPERANETVSKPDQNHQKPTPNSKKARLHCSDQTPKKIQGLADGDSSHAGHQIPWPGRSGSWLGQGLKEKALVNRGEIASISFQKKAMSHVGQTEHFNSTKNMAHNGLYMALMAALSLLFLF